jgi:hypothetical protein
MRLLSDCSLVQLSPTAPSRARCTNKPLRAPSMPELIVLLNRKLKTAEFELDYAGVVR